MSSKDPILRRAERTLDKHADARRLVEGKWSATDTPEDARALLSAVEQLERAEQALRWAEQDVARDERSAEGRAAKHRARALEVASIRKKLDRSMEGHLHTAADLIDGRADERLSDDEFLKFRRAVDRATDEQRLGRELGQLQARHEDAAKELRVVSEASVYAPDSDYSWFVDSAIVADRVASGQIGAAFGNLSPAGAEQRLTRYGREVRRDLFKEDKRARQIKAILRERSRHDDEQIHRRKAREELRALTSGGGATASASGGAAAAFVPPSFILEAWAPFRGTERVFADQCDPWLLPAYGLEVYVPVFSSTTTTGQQSELAGVSEGDPAATLQGAQVQTVTGQVTISQQLHDRGFTGGGAFDQAIAKQLRQQLDQSLNLYVLNQALAGTSTVTGSSSFSIANLYQDLAKGREQLTDTAGTRLRPTHLFTTSDFYSYVTRQVDATTNRPIVTPTFAPGFPIAEGADADNAPKWSRFTGTVLPGGVLWFTDDTIPASGSNTQLIVSAPEEAVVLAESNTPTLSVFSETYAGSLDVVVNLRSYVAAVCRHAAGTAVIVGNAYTTSVV